ncbi:MAG: hypothetical protein F4Z14_05210 [Gammaproteobacteria bacterium]|nr:hypothetical protein [Gammaproteobacteria bacterium]
MSFLDDEIHPSDWLGRRISSRSERRKAQHNKCGKGSPNTFELRAGESELSVDRLCRDEHGSPYYDTELETIAAEELEVIGRNLYGWAALTKKQVEEINGLSVHKSRLCTNPYHAHISVDFSHLNSDNIRDELARRARYVERTVSAIDTQ